MFNRNLPALCFVFVPDEVPGKHVAVVHRGEPGYCCTSYDTRDLDEAQRIVERLNATLGVSAVEQQCMQHGSIFGWNTPEADPKRAEAMNRAAT